MRKFYQLGITVLFLLAAALPAARAYNFVSDGIYYDITGGSPNTVAVTYATGSYNSYSGEVSIPSTVTYNGTHYTVTAIGNNAFRNCSNLTGVTIPGTVTSIGEYAFGGCSQLTEVTIPNGVETIGANAFRGCSGMTSFSFGNTVTSIGDYAFQSCSGLTTVAIPISVTTIGTSSFQYCDNLSSLIIGESVVSVGNSAFQSCGNLTSVVIPHSVKTIGGYAFRYCNSLSSVMFNADSCEVMGNSTETVFANCNHLTQLTIGNNVKSIPEYAFKGCDSLTTFFIPGAVSYIASNAFINCNHIATISVSAQNTTYDSRNNCNAIIHTSTNTLIYGCNNSTIPNSVRAIGEYAFYGREGLSGAFIIPDSVSVIGSSAFYGCSGLTSLTIGRNIDSIGVLSFGYCTGLNTINFNADSCKFMGYTYLGYLNYQTAFTGCNNISSLFIGYNVKVIPDLAFYGLNHISGMLFLPDSLIYIGSRAFNHCSSITGTLTIPQKVTFIGAQAFQDCSGISALVYNADSCTFGGEYYDPVFSGCNNLVSLSIGNNVRIIPDLAFSGCSNLTGSLTIPNTVKSIGFCAFRNCSGLIGTLSLPLSVTRIGDCAFYNCSGLTGELVIHDSVSYIGYWSFYNCTGLTSLTIGKTVDTINHSAFYACTGLVSVVFNADSCTYMGWRATCTLTQNTTYCPVFQDCANLTTLSIGGNVKIIPSYAFAGCSALSAVTIPRSVRQIGDAAFYGCENLSSVAFNADSCEGTNLFSNCTNITSITIGENVMNIPAGIFSGCTGLTGSLIFPSSLKNIGYNAFQGCNGLTGTLVIPDSVTSIGGDAFYGCSEFDTLVIGRAVTYIGSSAFYNCTGLTTVFFNADSCTGVWHPDYPVFSTCTNITSVIIGDNVKVIPAYSFMNSPALSLIVVGKGVKEIKEKAFYNCSNLATIFFNADSCTFIDNTGSLEHQRAFGYCNNLSSVVFGDNVKIIPEHAFHHCSSLAGTLVIPDSVVSIGTSAFQGCSGLDSLVIGENVSTIGYNAFKSCSGLETIIVGEKIDSIGNSSFYQCSGLRSVKFNATKCRYASHAFGECDSLAKVEFGNKVEQIPPYIFYGCSGLTDSLCIPDSIVIIGERAFSGCSGLTSIVFGNCLRTIGSGAFYNCSGLTGNLIIPNSVKSIESQSFANCSGLNSVSFGNSLEYIKTSAFVNCSGLTGVLDIPDSVRIIGNSAFSGCGSLTSLILGRAVDTLGTTAFSDCTGLTTITSYAINAPYTNVMSTSSASGAFKNISRQTPLYIPCGSTSSYQDAWRYYGTYVGYSPYFTNIYEISSYRLILSSEDTLKGTVQVTTQPTCTAPAVVEATPNFFYVFDHWSDGNTDNPRTITLTQDTTLVAHFREYAVTVASSDPTVGTAILTTEPTANEPYATALATLADTTCYVFAGWSDGSTENPHTISITQDTVLTAIFNPVVNLQVSIPSMVCQGDSITLTATGADNYLWFNGASTSSISLSPENALDVTVTGTNNNGCSTSKSQNINVLPKPALSLSGLTDICEGDSTTITCTGTPQTIFFEGFENALSSEWWTWGENGASWYSTIGTSLDAYEGEGAYAHNGNGFNYLLSPTIHIPEDGLILSYAVKQIRENGFNAAYNVYVNYVNDPSISNILYDFYYDNMLEEVWEERSLDLSDFAGQEIRLAFGQTYGMWDGYGTVIIDNVRLSGNPIFVWSDGYAGHQRSFSVAGTWFVTATGENGCSSIDSVTITVWQPDTVDVTVNNAGSYYVLNGEMFCQSGDYTQTLQNIHGCDSVVNLHLTVLSDTTVIYDTLCAGAILNQQVSMSPEEYQELLAMLEYQYGNSLPFELSYDTTTNTLTIKYVSIFLYEQWETGVNEYGYPIHDHFDTILYLNYTVWKDSAYYDDFSYTISYPSSTGCDSIVTFHRRILFSNQTMNTMAACGRHIWQGDSLIYWDGNMGDVQVFMAGDTITQSGDYYQYYLKDNGCDSVISWHFDITPAFYEDEYATACNSYTWNGITYTESGDYTLNSDTTLAVVRELYYESSNYYAWGYNDEDGNFTNFLPNGWSYWQVYEEYDAETGYYTYNYYYTDQYGVEHLYNPGDIVLYTDSVHACKSVTLHLTVNHPVTEFVEVTACDSYTWNDETYATSGDYVHTFTSANGCDSVVTLHLTVIPSVAELVEVTVCDSYEWNGQTYTTSGEYTQTFTAANGCDSTVTLQLTILPLPTPNITGVTTVCDGQTATLTATGGVSYLWEDGTTTNTYLATQSGTYTVTVTNSEGCSATAATTVTVNPLPEVVITGTTTICPGGSTILTATGADSYMWSNGSTNPSIPVNAFGQYSVIGTSAAGCFSTASVTVLVSQPPVITVSGNTDICSGESTTLVANGGVSYMWSNGSTADSLLATTAGNWQVIGYNEDGCSGMASVTVHLWQPAATNLYITSFDSCFLWFGLPRCESGDYTHTLQTIHGCDSVITLHLTLEDPITTEFSATSCGSYTWNSITYSQSGDYTQNFTAANGNDSIVTLHLTILDASASNFTYTACESYIWNGQTYTSSGDYTQTFTNANGCDSVVTLYLTVHHGTHNVETETACESFTWHGVTYTTSGTYTYEYNNPDGCASVDTLYLTVNYGTHNVETETACESFTWYGVTYTTSGTYTYEYNNPDGCASVDTLYLTVHYGTHNVETETACESLTWHGVTYTTSGTYTYEYYNPDGCASVDTLHLTVNHGTHNVETETACESFTWHGVTYTTSGTYTYEYSNSDGCASVDTLHLTIHYAVSSEITVATEDSCYTWNGESYCLSGDYTQTLQTVHGCDSVVTLHLTVSVGIDNYDGFDFKVYPNPTTGVVNVQCTMNNVQVGTIDFHVYDAYGKLVDVTDAGVSGTQGVFDTPLQTAQIDLSRYAPGVYFVKVVADGNVVAVRKVVKN